MNWKKKLSASYWRLSLVLEHFLSSGVEAEAAGVIGKGSMYPNTRGY